MPHRIIGIVCTSPGWGGLELNTLRLARWLREGGWKVHLLTAGDSPIRQHAGDAPSTIHEFSDAGLPGKGGQLRIIHAWVRRYKIRVLFIPYNKDIAVASLYKRFYSSDIGLIYQQHMQVGIRKHDLVHTLRYAMIDVWISPLQYLKEETLRLTRIPEKKIEVIPFGIEPERFTQGGWSREGARQALSLPQDAYIIGVLGRLDPKKGQDLIIRALQQLSARTADYHVLLTGNATLNEGDAYTQQMLQVVRTSGMEHRVHFRPYTDDVMVFFSAIDIFAMPSHGETFGMVTVEAMAAGMPVIGTDKDGTREILGEGKYGCLFRKDDVDSCCACITATRRDAQAPARTKAAQEAALQIYNKALMVSRISGILETLLQRQLLPEEG